MSTLDDMTLEETDADKNRGYFLATLGCIPGIGSLVSEIASNVIPDQRYNRLVEYLKILSSKIELLEEEKQNRIKNNVYCLDLVEEGFYQAARALSEERQEQIAEAVKNGIDDDNCEFTTSKHLLKLYSELDAEEVIWLKYYSYRTSYEAAPFKEKHTELLVVEHAVNSDSFDVREKCKRKEMLNESYKAHLERLNLIKKSYHTSTYQLTMDSGEIRDVRMPSWDDSYEEYEHKLEITYLGKQVLQLVGLYKFQDNELY